MTDIASILASYRSGQIDEAAMAEICREWPEVEIALNESSITNRPSGDVVEAGGCAPPVIAAKVDRLKQPDVTSCVLTALENLLVAIELGADLGDAVEAAETAVIDAKGWSGTTDQKLILPNLKGYSPWPNDPTPRRKFVIQVEAILDGVPGPWNQPEDLMRWINTHSYVRCVTLDRSDPQNADLKKGPLV